MHKKCLRSTRGCTHRRKTGSSEKKKQMRSGLTDRQFSRGNDVEKF